MDLDLPRTFLAVQAAGSFVRAAERLHVTQAAVSSRIQALEAELGRKLFVRNKAGARMTQAGHEFLPYATELVQVWEQARQRVALQAGRDAVLTLGGEFSLWSALVLNWVITLRKERPRVALRTYVNTAEQLLDGVQNGYLDIAVMYTPNRRPAVDIEPLFEEEMVAVTPVGRRVAMRFHGRRRRVGSRSAPRRATSTKLRSARGKDVAGRPRRDRSGRTNP